MNAGIQLGLFNEPPLRVVSLFAGIGGAEQALRQAEIQYDLLAWSEIASQAIKTYEAFWGEAEKNRGDILKMSTEGLTDVDLITGGFPCQPFANFGLQAGFDDPRFLAALEVVRVVKEIMPKYIFLENVAAILTKKFKVGITEYFGLFEALGYRTSIHRGNPKDFGALQSRTRVYIAFSRADVPMWTLPSIEEIPFEQQTFIVDSNADTDKNCFTIPDRFVKVVYGEPDQHFQCITRKGVASYCKRHSWIKHGEGYRSYTPQEFFQLFGWDRSIEVALTRGGVSRTGLSFGFGNSWHVGHAAHLLRSMP
jgi:DNA (cytosine-5)-methyltransferase 1